jgi:hypothetical protein
MPQLSHSVDKGAAASLPWSVPQSSGPANENFGDAYQANTASPVRVSIYTGAVAVRPRLDLLTESAALQVLGDDVTRLMKSVLDVELETVEARTETRISVSQVLRGGAAIASGFALMCLVGTMASGVPLMHPLLAILILIGGIGFASMSFFGAGS